MADLSGGDARDVHPPWGPKFFQFHAVFGKIWQNHMLAPPPRGNPGSATVNCEFLFLFLFPMVPEELSVSLNDRMSIFTACK